MLSHKYSSLLQPPPYEVCCIKNSTLTPSRQESPVSSIDRFFSVVDVNDTDLCKVIKKNEFSSQIDENEGVHQDRSPPLYYQNVSAFDMLSELHKQPSSDKNQCSRNFQKSKTEPSDERILEALVRYKNHHRKFLRKQKKDYQIVNKIFTPVRQYCLTTLYEIRREKSIEEPFYEVSHRDFSKQTFHENKWDLKINIPKDFSSTTLIVPGSLSVFGCDHCGGSGLVECSRCGGYHDITCDHCFGEGRNYVSYSSKSYNYTTKKMETQYENSGRTCGECYGNGTIRCYDCYGSGKQACVKCDETGKRMKYNQIDVDWLTKCESHFYGAPKCLYKFLESCKGSMLYFDEQKSLTSSLKPMNSQVCSDYDVIQSSKTLLKQHRCASFDQRIRKQMHFIKDISLYKITYKGKKKVKHLWMEENSLAVFEENHKKKTICCIV